MGVMKIRPAASVRGPVRVPGDKSISHRAAMIASLAEGRSRIENFADSEDCASTLSCLSQLGVKVERDGDSVSIDGVGMTGFSQPTGPLDCGNSGTTMRLLAGILAAQPIKTKLTGDDSLRKRPMRRIIEPLTQMGAKIHAADGRAPLNIEGGPLRGIEYEMPVASAQLKSCLLLAGLNAEGETAVIERVRTRDHSERVLRSFGVEVEERPFRGGRRISVAGGQTLKSQVFTVPGDVSSAAFFVAAAAALPGSMITIENLGLNPTRAALLDLVRLFGARIEVSDTREVCGEPVVDVTVRGGPEALETAKNGRVEGSTVANLIDEIPILAVLGTQLRGGLEIRDASELRVKESDRIASVVENLRRMGATVEERPDGLRVETSILYGCEVDSFGDHRIAMAFAVAGLLAKGETTIKGADCAAVSFPNFFEMLDSVAVR